MLQEVERGNRLMNRKLILPLLAGIALLAGCATGYQYRGGTGDYYYGSPSVEYRVYGGYGYGYPGYYPYGGYYGGYYGYPYYGGGYYYYPWYRHGHGHGHGGHDHGGGGDDGNDGDSTPDRPTPPWRDLGSLGNRGKFRELGGKLPPRTDDMAPMARPGSQPRVPVAPRTSAPPRPRVSAPSLPSRPAPMPRTSGGGDGERTGSRMSGMLRRSQQ